MAKYTKKAWTAWALAGMLVGSQALAAEYWLWAGQMTRTMPTGEAIPLWGFALEPDGDFTTLEGKVQVPGPRLTVPPGEGLTVHLLNNLPGPHPPPVSLVIPGQALPAGSSPTWVDLDASGNVLATYTGSRPPGNVTARVRSFVDETAPGQVGTYVWDDIRPGTYLYHSGTHPAVQVQMGLYGPLTKDVAPGEAYPGVFYDREALIFLSEIDAVIHHAVASGDFGFGKSITSAIDYLAKYFLINGEPFTPDRPSIAIGGPGERTLLRFVNAGLETHNMVLRDDYVTLLAEDGFPAPHPQEAYSVLLHAGKARDAVLDPSAFGSHALYDMKFGLSNAGHGPGGMMAYLEAGGGEALGNTDIDFDARFVGFPPMAHPVVIAGLAPGNPPQGSGAMFSLPPGVVRVSDVARDGFQALFQPWPYVQGGIERRGIGYLVMEEGRHRTRDGCLIEVGSFDLGGATGTFQPVDFAESFMDTPALFLTVQTTNDPTPVIAVARNVTRQGFDATLLVQQADLGAVHGTERVGYMAVFPQDACVLDLPSGPVPLEATTTLVGSDVATVLGRRLRLEEEQSMDAEMLHISEDVSVMKVGDVLFAQQVSSRQPDPAAPVRVP